MNAPLAQPLSAQGFDTGAKIYANLGTPALVEHALQKGEGRLTKDGALLVDTGKFTGRSVKDKFVVRDAVTELNARIRRMGQALGCRITIVMEDGTVVADNEASAASMEAF